MSEKIKTLLTKMTFQLLITIVICCLIGQESVATEAADSSLDLLSLLDSSTDQGECSLPCMHGECNMVSDIEAQCLCHPGFTGSLCTDSLTDDSDQSQNETTRNDGGAGDDLHNSTCGGPCDQETTAKKACIGDCVINNITCEAECLAVGDDQAEAPKDQCFISGTKCYHGTCPGYFTCECDPDYTGETCSEVEPISNGEEEEQAGCPETCGSLTALVFCTAGCEINKQTCAEECLPSQDVPVTSAPNTICNETGMACYHGSCPDGHVCECDVGYKGEDCNTLQCTLGCVHGICIETGEYSVDCHCDPGYGGMLCNEPECTLECIHGSCLYLSNYNVADEEVTAEEAGTETPPDSYNGSMVCTCEHDWIGELCDQPKPDPPGPDYTIALAVGITVPIVCILAFILALYILWRHRVLWVFKVINMFKAYEDDDDKLYDAYISLSETDLCFVKTILQPKLEEMGLRIFLQARDAGVGEVKSESILEAVEKSRRCIMLISANYVSNEWCRFEYLIAQHETCVKLRQRIIPIMLEDVEKDKKSMDKALRHIVDSVKCLRYPQLPPTLSPASPVSPASPASPVSIGFDLEGNQTRKIKKQLAKHERSEARFWERLRLSMPKKKGGTEVDVKSPSLSCDSSCPLSMHSHRNWSLFSCGGNKQQKTSPTAYFNGACFENQFGKQGNPISLVSAKDLTDSKLNGIYNNDVILTSSNGKPGAEISAHDSKNVTPVDVNTLSVRL